MKYKILGLMTAACLVVPLAAQAASRSQTGSAAGFNWKAETRIVGATSTATAVGGGNPLYFAAQPKYSGVVSLIMEYEGGAAFICSGTLLADRRSVLTAGHCVSDGTSARPIKTTAYFYGGSNPDTFLPFNPAATAIEVKNYHVNAGYTGEVIDQNDIAVLRLAAPAPAFATSFGIYNVGDLTGDVFNVAGYGRRSDTGGAIGANLGAGRLRQGDNKFDFRLGDEDFGGFFTDEVGGRNFFGTAQIDFSFISDFDNGLAANDGSCRLGGAFGLGGAKYCNNGLLPTEVSVAGGDSGGPQFVDGKIASVTSYGLSFGPNFGDIDRALNSSFGELNGFVPTYIHADWISSVVPEPSSWAMLIAGFGLVGATARRARAIKSVNA